MALVPVPVAGAGLLSGVAMLGMVRAGKRWREARQRKQISTARQTTKINVGRQNGRCSDAAAQALLFDRFMGLDSYHWDQRATLITMFY